MLITHSLICDQLQQIKKTYTKHYWRVHVCQAFVWLMRGLFPWTVKLWKKLSTEILVVCLASTWKWNTCNERRRGQRLILLLMTYIGMCLHAYFISNKQLIRFFQWVVHLAYTVNYNKLKVWYNMHVYASVCVNIYMYVHKHTHTHVCPSTYMDGQTD